MKVEMKRTADAPWETVAGASCVQVDKNHYRVTLPTVAFVPVAGLDGMPLRIDGVEAQQVLGSQSTGGAITLEVLLPVQRFGGRS